MAANLFAEFPPTTKNDWEKQARKELKEKFETALQWDAGPGLHFDSYVTGKDIDPQKVLAIQHSQKKVPGWLNTPLIAFHGPAQTNLAIKNNLENGADAVLVDLGELPFAKCEFPKLLHGVRLSDTAVFFRTKENAAELFNHISKHAGYYIKGGVVFDPIANWAETGERFEKPIGQIVTLLNLTKNMREFRVCSVESHLYHANGADPARELACILAETVTYMDLLTEAGIAPLLALNRIFFSVAIGPKYLTEIAKLRALRFLLRRISRAYQLPDEVCNPFLQAKTSPSNTPDSSYDELIRASSSAMSAVLGGCNALTVSSIHAGSAEFAERITRNISSIMRYESGLEHVADPAAGSYSLESMTLNLVEKAWELFLDIEEKGGFISCVENGIIQVKPETR
ncbi:methylmalonyl-CoA mutase family protein [Dyadobacter sp. CY323]|uniref:methylmalonyl-CoA mutase family protein n=1 Tax=Dyadobacter sp. CY323 TaxID=2907302 RepID=UPI001F21574D|nr:methylmalonyl-CoA mutase family protein [Dyadobacter sp. CY323]MCE6992562.1 methylmalonyl-CoA mutase family protein [Dyadobacter sp. CY323]